MTTETLFTRTRRTRPHWDVRDGCHGKRGFVGGNVRYSRRNPAARMGRARNSRFTRPGRPARDDG